MTEQTKPGWTTCSGPSMYPTLKPGDGIILDTGRCPAVFRRGDVIVYSHPVAATDVVHRIIRTTPVIDVALVLRQFSHR